MIEKPGKDKAAGNKDEALTIPELAASKEQSELEAEVDESEDTADSEDTAESKAQDSSKQNRSMSRRIGTWAAEVVAVIVGAAIISMLLRAFVFQMFVIPSGSMENTLQVNDRVVAVQMIDFERGDVIVFKDPGNWLNETPEPRGFPGNLMEAIGVLPSTDAGYLVKRVIGIEGDRVQCCDNLGRIIVNGVGLDESGYLYSNYGNTVAPSDIRFDVIVPKDHVFVLGDHRNSSGDSRCHLSDDVAGQPRGSNAFISESSIVGPVKAVVAPFSRTQRIRIPEVFQSIPPAAGEPPAEPVIKDAGPGC